MRRIGQPSILSDPGQPTTGRSALCSEGYKTTRKIRVRSQPTTNWHSNFFLRTAHIHTHFSSHSLSQHSFNQYQYSVIPSLAMQLSSLLSTLLFSSAAFAYRATYDTTFDNPTGSMNGVACSNGENGLAAQYPTFSDLPSFPNIGGAFPVRWNSPSCGSCWLLEYEGRSVYITAIDTAGHGFNIALEALNTLTGGQGLEGSFEVEATEVDRSYCGM